MPLLKGMGDAACCVAVFGDFDTVADVRIAADFFDYADMATVVQLDADCEGSPGALLRHERINAFDGACDLGMRDHQIQAFNTECQCNGRSKCKADASLFRALDPKHLVEFLASVVAHRDLRVLFELIPDLSPGTDHFSEFYVTTKRRQLAVAGSN